MRRLAVIAAVVLSGSTLQAQTVTRVIDGDTIVVATVGAVRLIGVDTPETVDPRRPVQAFGKEASDFLKGFIQGKSVRLTYDQTRKDRYDRTLAYAYLADGTFVNREIIRRGYGHAYLEFPFKFMEDFRVAQREAMVQRRGLWGDYRPIRLEPLPRCQSLTQEGSQCKRNASANSDFCRQHQGANR